MFYGSFCPERPTLYWGAPSYNKILNWGISLSLMHLPLQTYFNKIYLNLRAIKSLFNF
jgi:hypothetical protein